MKNWRKNWKVLKHYEYDHVLIAREVWQKARAKYGWGEKETASSFSYFWYCMELCLDKYQKYHAKPIIGVLNYEQADLYWQLATTEFKEAQELAAKKIHKELSWASKSLGIDAKPLIQWTNLKGNLAYFEEGSWKH